MSGLSIKKDSAPIAAKTGKIKLFPNEQGRYSQIDEEGNVEELAIKSEVPKDINELNDEDVLLKMENDNIFKDWFLPSLLEMRAMRLVLYVNGLGGFDGTKEYWTSTEASNQEAHLIQRFDQGGIEEVDGKNGIRIFRPCRFFIASDNLYSLGDIGPAGGYIFIISDYLGQKAYFEAAPNDLPAQKWSNVSSLIGTTSSDIGSGLSNSQKIIAQEGHEISSASACISNIVTLENTNLIRPKSSKKIHARHIESLPESNSNSNDIYSETKVFELGIPTNAQFVGQVLGMTSNITLTAASPGTLGNEIVLIFDGIKTIEQAMIDWNNANPKNIFNSQIGDDISQVPAEKETMKFSGGSNGDQIVFVINHNLNGSIYDVYVIKILDDEKKLFFVNSNSDPEGSKISGGPFYYYNSECENNWLTIHNDMGFSFDAQYIFIVKKIY